MTPKEAIKEFCRTCTDGDARHVKDCDGDKIACPLYPVRIKEGKISVRVIRAACLYCMGGDRYLVGECEIFACPLHQYRMGKNEAHKSRLGRPVEVLQKGS